jgi:hypothetical protein
MCGKEDIIDRHTRVIATVSVAVLLSDIGVGIHANGVDGQSDVPYAVVENHITRQPECTLSLIIHNHLRIETSHRASI